MGRFAFDSRIAKMDTSRCRAQYDEVERGFTLDFLDSWLKATTIEVIAVEILYL